MILIKVNNITEYIKKEINLEKNLILQIVFKKINNV